jgi:hypothetical protein
MFIPLELMPIDFDLASLIKKQLTHEEIAHGVAYIAEPVLSAGTHLDFPKTHLDVPWDAFLVFVDREPMANWSHSCRYLLIRGANGDAKSIEAQLPPFGRETLQWRIVYRAPGVPDSISAVPQSSQ